MKIDYRVLNNPANETLKEELFDVHLNNFLEFLKKHFKNYTKTDKKLDVIITTWWFHYGPLNFASHEDCTKFKKELSVYFKQKTMFLEE